MKFIFLLIIAATSLFCGCSCGVNGMVWNNISEMVDFVVCGESEDYRVSLMCGRRELNYKKDGISNELIPYGVVTLYCLEEDSKIENVNFILFVGTKQYKGNMEKNFFDGSWVADIKKVVDVDENISIDIYVNQIKSSMKLNSINENWTQDSNDIVNLLVREYKDAVKSFVNKGELEAEIFVKLINDYDKYSDRFYFNIIIYGQNEKYFTLLICPKTGDVLASSCN